MRWAWLALLAAACGSSDPDYLTRDQLLDPTTCKTCHPDQFREWSGSMHAYAADDPVFLAMNARGQRETGGQLGKFCVKCHAPMAVEEAATSDGLNLASLPAKLKGVTCFFCHTVDKVTDTHNNPLLLAGDIKMRGPLSDAVSNTGHPSGYSMLHDRERAESATLCGSCHDIVTTGGGAIERTFAEWQGSVFSHANTGATCGQCHMDQSPNLRPIASAPHVFSRRYHSHAFPALDTAMVAGFPEVDAQKTLVKTLLDTTLQSSLCVKSAGGPASLRVIVDNVAAGHGFPSGSAQDRRLWAEVIAYKDGNVIYQSGVVPDGTPVTTAPDPDLWLLRDCMLDAQQQPVPMFWQATGFETNQLPALATFDQTDPRFYMTHIVQNFPRTADLPVTPDRVTLRMRVQPIGLDVLDDLIGSHDLDPAVRAAMPTFDIGTKPLLEWTAATAKDSYLEGGTQVFCISNTNLNAGAQKVQAPAKSHCSP